MPLPVLLCAARPWAVTTASELALWAYTGVSRVGSVITPSVGPPRYSRDRSDTYTAPRPVTSSSAVTTT